MQSRIQVPKQAKRGEVIRIGVLLQHPMETGYRQDAEGRKIPKNVIRSLVCRYDGVEVFRAEMSPGIAANLFLQFSTVAEASGELEFTWTDDAGNRGVARESIRVA